MIARLSEWLWERLAAFLVRPKVVDWLIKRATATPYVHLQDTDGSFYMMRYWLLNPYQFGKGGTRTGWRNWFPSVRLHHIMREDLDPHTHDHPWEARTIILRGAYLEDRLERRHPSFTPLDRRLRYCRLPGDTAKLTLGMFHHITSVTPGGVWTLFITWKYQGTWGFMVNGQKVPYKEYLAGSTHSRPAQPTSKETPK